jgi:hypothetical protein
VEIDGIARATNVDMYDPVRQNVRLFSMGGLSRGQHALKITLNGQKNPKSSAAYLVHDYFVTYQDP